MTFTENYATILNKVTNLERIPPHIKGMIDKNGEFQPLNGTQEKTAQVFPVQLDRTFDSATMHIISSVNCSSAENIQAIKNEIFNFIDLAKNQLSQTSDVKAMQSIDSQMKDISEHVIKACRALKDLSQTTDEVQNFDRIVGELSQGIQAKTDAVHTIVQRFLIDEAMKGGSYSCFEKLVNNQFLFDKNSPEGLEAIVQITLKAKENRSVFENISQLPINRDTYEGQKALIKMAKACASMKLDLYVLDPANLAFIRSLPAFGINSKTPEGAAGLREIALIYAENTGWKVGTMLDVFGLNPETSEDQAILVELAKRAAKTDKFFSIKSYGIKEQKERIEIAKIRSLGGTAEDVRKTITGEEVAKTIADYAIEPSTVEGQRGLIDIAKNVASSGKISQFIANFKIDKITEEGHQAYIDIAGINADAEGYDTAKYFKNFGFDAVKDQRKIVEIAKKMIPTSYGGVSEFVHEFGIQGETDEGQKALVELALLEAERAGETLSKYFKNYKIRNVTPKERKQVIQIALKAVERSLGNAFEYVKNFEIDEKSPQGRSAINTMADITARKKGRLVNENIKDYPIDRTTPEGQAALIRVAKLAAYQNPDDTSLNIHNYGIDATTLAGKKGLNEIAEILAKESPTAFFESAEENLIRFEIDPKTSEGQATLIRLFRLGIEKTSTLIFTLKDLPFDSPKIKLSLISLALTKDIKLASKLYIDTHNSEILLKSDNSKCYNSEEFEDVIHRVLLYGKHNFPHLNLEPVIQDFRELIAKEDKKQKESADPPDFVKSNNSLEWLLFTLAKLTDKEPDQQTQQWVSDIFPHILDIHSPDMRFRFSNFITEHFVNNQDAMKNYSDLQQPSKTEDKKGKVDEKGVAHTILPNLIIALWPGFKKEDRQNLSGMIKKFRVDSTPLFKVAGNMNILLQTLHTIFMMEDLTDEDKSQLLKDIFANKDNGKALVKQLTKILTIINLGGSSQLSQTNIKEAQEKDSTHDRALDKILGKQFTDKIPVKNVPDLGEKLIKKMDSFADFNTIYTYGGRINRFRSPDKEMVMKMFAEYVEKVLNDEFKTWRYEANESEVHLNIVFANRPDLKEKWIQNKSIPYAMGKHGLNKTEGSAQQIDYIDLFRTSFEDGHIRKEKYPVFWSFLQPNRDNLELVSNNLMPLFSKENFPVFWKSLQPDVNGIISIEKALSAQIGVFAKEKRDIESLRLQSLGIQLALSKDPSQSLRLLKQLKEYCPDIQFKKDLESALKSLEERNNTVTKNPYANWKIVETDDPSLLLHCGTHFEGSCQNVTNIRDDVKCLPAYLVDGKNKMIAILDDKGKIRARAFIRLLIDEKTKKPILFLERMYPKILPQEHVNVLLNVAKDRARELGLPLLSKQVEDGKPIPYNGVIKSLGGKAPFEYVDALAPDGIQEKSEFKIRRCHEINVN